MKTHTTSNVVSKIIICGGRNFDNYYYLTYAVDDVLSELGLDYDEVEIVSGNCSGADQLGERYADEHDIPCNIFPADWEKYGRAAGPIRNSAMLDYAKNCEIPIVIAFVSPKSKGTLDTVNKAKKQGFKIYINEYNTIEAAAVIFGGVRPLEDSYEFDFNEDKDGDIINLTKQHINTSRLSGNIRYFGYKINQLSDNDIKKSFLSWIKSPEGYTNPGFVEMIDRCVEEFTENNSTQYDYIIPVASSSRLTSILSDKLANAFSCNILYTSKSDVKELQLNKDKLIADMKDVGKSDDYIDNLIDFIQTRYIEPQKKFNQFSIHKISPKYRKWISPMFKFSEDLDLSSAKNILIVDETITSGESINQIIELIRSQKYTGTITIFTLLNNR